MNAQIPSRPLPLGPEVAAGVDLPLGKIRLAPEVRVARWTSEHYGLGSNRNECEFALTIKCCGER